MQVNDIKLNKNDISYEFFESKKQNSDTILILHGWRWASSSWTKVWDFLNMSDYNVIIPDIPWASKLTKCHDIYTIDLYAEIIENFIEDLKIKYWNEINFDNLILWWHSNWWAISIKIANRKKIKILRLVLNNSAWIRNDKKRNFKRKILWIIVKPFKILKNKKLKKFFYKLIWNYDYLETLDNPNLKQTYLNMINCDLREEIKNIDLFTLILWWEFDNYTPIEDGYFMRDNIKKSKLIVLSNETHGIHIKNPKRLVETFLQNI